MREWLSEIWLRTRTLVRRRRIDADLESELQFHLEMRAAKNLESGLTAGDARDQARRRFGNVSGLKEACREMWTFARLETWLQDLRYGVRTLLKTRALTAVAVLSLALGIGANTAIFSLIDTLMLRSLPVHEPKELIRFRKVNASGGFGYISYPLFESFRDQGRSFRGVLGTAGVGRTTWRPDGAAGSVEPIAREYVTGDYFAVLGVGTTLGRTLKREDDRVGAPPIAVVSYGLWQRRLGFRTDVIGKVVILSDQPVTIVGVAQPGFSGVEVGYATEMWLPALTQADAARLINPGMNWMTMIARLPPGTGLREAEAEAGVLLNQELTKWVAQFGQGGNAKQRRDFLATRMRVEAGYSGLSRLRDRFSEPLFVLMALVGLVLLIACGNVANLLLARGSARQREMAVRLAIGAGRARLVRQLLTESVLLAGLGGIAGVFLAWWGCQLLIRFVPTSQVPLALDITPDLRVLAFTAAVALLSGILFGIAPALRATRSGLATALKNRAANVAGVRGRLRLDRTLVALQVALSILLLAGAGLFARSLRNLKNFHPGFAREDVLAFGLGLPRAYSPQQSEATLRQALERLERIPGVRAVSYSFPGPLGIGGWGGGIRIPGFTPGPEENMDVAFFRMTPRFFETMAIPLRQGRIFDARDTRTGPKAVVVNEALVRRFFPGSVPIGRQIERRREGGSDSFEIVGVVGDVFESPRKPAPAAAYFAFDQVSGPLWGQFSIRTAPGAAASVMSAVRPEIGSVDKSASVESIRTIADSIDEALIQERAIAALSVFFGGVALLLACIGLYGLMSYAVSRRTGEIGIRVALGARRGNVSWMVLRETLGLVAVGIAIGVPAAIFASRLVTRLLFGLSGDDPVTLIAASALMLAVAMLAGYVPARRAAAVDPMVALRCD